MAEKKLKYQGTDVVGPQEDNEAVVQQNKKKQKVAIRSIEEDEENEDSDQLREPELSEYDQLRERNILKNSDYLKKLGN
jgi:hypothetical protein